MRPNEPTAKYFYSDGYSSESSVWIDDHATNDLGQQYLIFNETIFYPHGGGQKSDRGVIDIPDDISKSTGLPNTIRIVDTRKEGDFIRHFLEAPIDENILEEYIIGDRKFKIRIDWGFRYTQMRLHTIAHLLHYFMERVLDTKIEFPTYSELMEGFGINRYPEMDLVSTDQLASVLNEQNAWMRESHPIATYANEDSSFPDWYRWWECGAFKIPCGGIHPHNTNEIGPVEATVSSKKGNTSIRFSLSS